jgi:hypothetical protein
VNLIIIVDRNQIDKVDTNLIVNSIIEIEDLVIQFKIDLVINVTKKNICSKKEI